jgi:hypothetical protein
MDVAVGEGTAKRFFVDEPICVRNSYPALAGLSSKERQMKFAGKTVQKLAVLTAVLGAVFSLANPAFAGNADKNEAQAKVNAKVLESSMTPGEGQKRLEPMVGTFDVQIRTWVDPSKPPVESRATSVSAWVLGNRYIQTMLSGYVLDEPFNGIGYIGYDNASKTYQAAWMDTGSTGITWYTGKMGASGKSAIMKASVSNPLTAKPAPVELRLSIAENGGHVTEIWGQGNGTKPFKMMELRYTKTR